VSVRIKYISRRKRIYDAENCQSAGQDIVAHASQNKNMPDRPTTLSERLDDGLAVVVLNRLLRKHSNYCDVVDGFVGHGDNSKRDDFANTKNTRTLRSSLTFAFVCPRYATGILLTILFFPVRTKRTSQIVIVIVSIVKRDFRGAAAIVRRLRRRNVINT